MFVKNRSKRILVMNVQAAKLGFRAQRFVLIVLIRNDVRSAIFVILPFAILAGKNYLMAHLCHFIVIAARKVFAAGVRLVLNVKHARTNTVQKRRIASVGIRGFVKIR